MSIKHEENSLKRKKNHLSEFSENKAPKAKMHLFSFKFLSAIRMKDVMLLFPEKNIYFSKK
jgi:cytoskeletal protein RodZ